MSDVGRQKDLDEARARRTGADAVKRKIAMRLLGEGASIVAVMRAVNVDRKTVERWKEEIGNG